MHCVLRYHRWKHLKSQKWDQWMIFHVFDLSFYSLVIYWLHSFFKTGNYHSISFWSDRKYTFDIFGCTLIEIIFYVSTCLVYGLNANLRIFSDHFVATRKQFVKKTKIWSLSALNKWFSTNMNTVNKRSKPTPKIRARTATAVLFWPFPEFIFWLNDGINFLP